MNKKWVIIYLLIGLFNAFMSNYKADYFQKVVDRLTDRTMTVYEILFYGVILFINYGMNYIDEYPSAKLGNEIYLDFKLLALRKIGRMDYSEYQKLGTGKLVQQIENGANAGKGVLYDFWFCVVRNLLPTILFGLYFIWKIDRTITYFLLAGYIIVFLVTNLLLKGLYRIKEKTSALDNVTEGIVMKNVLEQISHATVIAVTHRLTSVQEFDRIVVFSNGKIVGNGTFDELLENNSYFFDLYRKEKGNSN